MSGPSSRVENDEGSTLLLTIFYGFLCLVLVLIVIAATSLYLERTRLFTLADGAAVAGAEGFELEDVAASGSLVRPDLTDAQVRAAVADYLEAVPDPGFVDLRVRRAAAVDGQSATVTLSAAWRPPMVGLLVPNGLPIEVTSVGRSVFR